jgi:hypothetical protein
MPVKACSALGAALVAAVVAGCGTAEAGKAGSDLPTYAADATATGTAGVGGSGSADASSTGPSAGAGVGGSGAIGDIGSAGASSGAESPPPKADRRLRGLSLVTADVRHLGLVAKPDEDATSLDWTSVALCDDKEHPSERRRVARYQVTAVPPGWTGRLGDGSKPRYDDPTLESAVTAYGSPASATSTTSTTCSAWPSRWVVASRPGMTGPCSTSVERTPGRAHALPPEPCPLPRPSLRRGPASVVSGPALPCGASG